MVGKLNYPARIRRARPAQHRIVQRAPRRSAVLAAHRQRQRVTPDGVAAAAVVDQVPPTADARKAPVFIDAAAYRTRSGDEYPARAGDRAAQGDLMVSAQDESSREARVRKLTADDLPRRADRYPRAAEAYRGAVGHVPAGGEHLAQPRGEALLANGGNVERTEALAPHKPVFRRPYFKLCAGSPAVYSGYEHCSHLVRSSPASVRCTRRLAAPRTAPQGCPPNNPRPRAARYYQAAAAGRRGS